MIKLLSNQESALFETLPNACLLQLTGTPLSDQKLDNYSLFPNDHAVTIGGKKRRRKGAPRKRRRKAKKDGEEQEEDVMPEKHDEEEEMWAGMDSIDIEAFSSLEARLAPLPPPSPSASPPTTIVPSPLVHAKRKLALVAPIVQMRNPKKRQKLTPLHSPNSVVFIRAKMMHARPCLVARNRVAYGFDTHHVLLRLPELFPPGETQGLLTPLHRQALHLLKYIFPLRFGFLNVFTFVKGEWKSTISALNFEAGREQEIVKLGAIKTPKRLKPIVPLLEQMIKLHCKCRYRQFLDQFCPSRYNNANLSQVEKSLILESLSQQPQQELQTQASPLTPPSLPSQLPQIPKPKPKFSDFMCSYWEVESFVRKVVRRVIPRDLWGSEENEEGVWKCVKQYIRARRYETTSLHLLLQNFSINECAWVKPLVNERKTGGEEQRSNEVEMRLRRELMGEFLYWFFAGFVVELIKTNFYVTESTTFRNRTLYFRQDDWHALCKPILENYSTTIFERLDDEEAKKVLQKKGLGFSYVRLLPKERGVRAIVNLKRRAVKVGGGGQQELGPSINFVLQNAFKILTFEKSRNASLLGASTFGPNEIYARLKRFKVSLMKDTFAGTGELPKLYFVKVDIKSCYDTIDQTKLLEIIERVLKDDVYQVQKYGMVRSEGGKVRMRWMKEGKAGAGGHPFPDLARRLASSSTNTIYCDGITPPMPETRQKLLELLAQHLKSNIVKIGGGYYKQTEGIAQGSVVSSILCAFFYGDLERVHLGFTREKGSLLLRYIDDFMFITTSKPLAKRFLEVMEVGHAEYGCYIAKEKSLTNFDFEGRPTGGSRLKEFPWCGHLFNTQTLDIKSDITRYTFVDMADTLTVEFCKKPGEAFLRKMLLSVRLRANSIYTDTTHNSLSTVYLNAYQTMLVVGCKFVAYLKGWRSGATVPFLLGVIKQIVAYNYTVILGTTITSLARGMGVESRVQRRIVIWLGNHAFHRVFTMKPSGVYAILLKRLKIELGNTGSGSGVAKMMRGVIRTESNGFIHQVREPGGENG